ISWQGFDWDGSGEETLTLNGQFIASLPAVDTPQNANVYVAFSLNTTLVIQGVNRLTFTHANFDCPVTDSVKNLRVENGLAVVYSNSTVEPLSCAESLTYTFTVGGPPPLNASFTYSPTNSVSGQAISFSATASGGKSPYTFTWNFGDGSSTSGSAVTHTYASFGSFNVTLTATDSSSQSTAVSKIVTVTLRSSATTVTCPASGTVGVALSCSATITDTSPGTASTPSGTVGWAHTNAGFFSVSNCTLASGSCSVTYTATAQGSHVITGSYGGDATHAASQGSDTIAVAVGTTTTSVSCSPNPVAINQLATCTATVTDTSAVGTAPT